MESFPSGATTRGRAPHNRNGEYVAARRKATKAEPSPNGPNGSGRKADGRFAKGWKGGPGNPFAKRIAEYQSAIRDAVSVDALRGVVDNLLAMASGRDGIAPSDQIAAAKVLLDRLIGKPQPFSEPLSIDIGDRTGNALIAHVLMELCRQVASGSAAPAALKDVADSMAKASDVLERSDLEERIRKLEAARG